MYVPSFFSTWSSLSASCAAALVAKPWAHFCLRLSSSCPCASFGVTATTKAQVKLSRAPHFGQRRSGTRTLQRVHHLNTWPCRPRLGLMPPLILADGPGRRRRPREGL